MRLFKETDVQSSLSHTWRDLCNYEVVMTYFKGIHITGRYTCVTKTVYGGEGQSYTIVCTN